MAFVCSPMAITEGDTVAVHYTGKLEDGQVFDSSEGRGPLEFTVGAGELIPGFDNAVRGLEKGEKTTVELPPEDAYGPHDPEKVQEISREQLDLESPEPGQMLGLQTPDGQQFQATVLDVTDSAVKLDFNHFLAGKKLTFDIEVVDN